MKLPTQRKLNDALCSLARRYNGSRDMAHSSTGTSTEFYRGYYNGIDVATREFIRLLNVNRDEWDKLLDD